MKILFSFRGKVKDGAKRGKSFGFPTANIALHKQIPEGVYISIVKINDQTFQGATFIGPAKTFQETDYKAEVHILDFSQDLYGKLLSVQLLKKIHENIKFPGKKELIEQMGKDVEEVRKYFRNVG